MIDLSSVTGGTYDLQKQTISGLALNGKSFDPAKPLRFVNGTLDGAKFTNCANIIFACTLINGLTVMGGSNIGLEGADASGMPGVPAPQQTGKAVHIENVTGAFARKSAFHDAMTGLVLRLCTKSEVLKSQFHDLRKDGAHIAGCTDTLVEDNDLTDFRSTNVSGTGDHPDGIQAFSAGTVPNTNLTIRRNRVWRGSGVATQGIFCQPTQVNLLIEDNIVAGCNQNGITASNDATVRGNMVIAYIDPATGLPDKSSLSWVGVDPARITGNKAPKFTDSAIKFKTPVPAGNEVVAAMTPSEAQVILDGWRPAPTPPPIDPVPVPLPDPVPTPTPTPYDPLPELIAMRDGLAAIITKMGG